MTTTDTNAHQQTAIGSADTADHQANDHEKATGVPVAASGSDGLATEVEALLKLLESKPWSSVTGREPQNWRNLIQRHVAALRTCQRYAVEQQAAQYVAGQVHQSTVQALAISEAEAGTARNTLARSLDRIDGSHSSSLTDCAERAAELLARRDDWLRAHEEADGRAQRQIDAALIMASRTVSDATTDRIDYVFPLRKGVTVQLTLPPTLTKRDIERLIRCIGNLPTEDEDEEGK